MEKLKWNQKKSNLDQVKKGTIGDRRWNPGLAVMISAQLKTYHGMLQLR